MLLLSISCSYLSTQQCYRQDQGEQRVVTSTTLFYYHNRLVSTSSEFHTHASLSISKMCSFIPLSLSFTHSLSHTLIRPQTHTRNPASIGMRSVGGNKFATNGFLNYAMGTSLILLNVMDFCLNNTKKTDDYVGGDFFIHQHFTGNYCTCSILKALFNHTHTHTLGHTHPL